MFGWTEFSKHYVSACLLSAPPKWIGIPFRGHTDGPLKGKSSPTLTVMNFDRIDRSFLFFINKNKKKCFTWVHMKSESVLTHWIRRQKGK